MARHAEPNERILESARSGHNRVELIVSQGWNYFKQHLLPAFDVRQHL